MTSIKKFFPLQLLAILAFIVVGALYIGDSGYLSAKKSELEKKKIKHYEAILVKHALITDLGKKISKEELSKGIVILNFWATWCTPCLEEFPSIVTLRNKFPKNKLKIIAINSDEDQVKKSIAKVRKKYQLNFDIVLDSKGSITDEFMITAIPVSIIYHNGKVIEISNGARDFASEEFFETMAELIK